MYHPKQALHPELLVCVLLFANCFSRPASCQSSTGGEECIPQRCGNLTDIRYPFWLTGKQSDSCGLFQVTCDDGGIPMLEKSYNRYYSILNISYNERSVTIRNRHLLEQKCLLPQFNVSYGLTLLALSKVNRNLSFVYGCNASLSPPEYYPVLCNGNKSGYAHLGGQYEAPQEPLRTGDQCKISVFPVLGFDGATSKDYEKLMSGGFRLQWNSDDCANCSQCATGTCDCAVPTRCKKNHHKIRGIVIGISIGIGGILISTALWFALYFWRRKRRLRSSSALRSLSAELDSAQYGTHIFSYKELEEATNGFSESKELGDGGFGTVYKGKLQDGRIVAIKRLYGSNYKRLEQFMNEVDILSSLRHRNLVTLYGCTSRHSRDLLLVYEFVPNGTVADHLYGPRRSSGSLTWPVRMSIAIETADALSYLHAIEPQIIHRDVKTNNILLDEGFHVKVADFGLSRLFPANATHVSTAPQGTPGYVDPEYHRFYQLTDKSDVYSFGVVLAELISSKPAVDVTRQLSEINLANLVTDKILKQELDQLVDPVLGYESHPEIKVMIDSVAELALRCLQTDRNMRPAIKEVAEVLREIENGAFRKEKGTEDDEIAMVVIREDAVRLLKSEPPYSPISVTQRWTSVPPTSSASV